MTATLQSAFARFFTDAATPIDLGEDRLIVLDDVRRVLLVDHGDLDLFAVYLDGGRPSGRWSPLCRVGAGTALVCGPRSTYAWERPRYSGGTACAPKKVGTTVPGHSRAAARMASSDFSSDSGLRP